MLMVISVLIADFPSFSEGLSLRREMGARDQPGIPRFPFLFGGAFIEAPAATLPIHLPAHFPSFSEGLSLRRTTPYGSSLTPGISLPFRRGFH